MNSTDSGGKGGYSSKPAEGGTCSKETTASCVLRDAGAERHSKEKD